MSAFTFVVHTSNCHDQNCTRRAIYRLGIDTLIANILVYFICLIIKQNGTKAASHSHRSKIHPAASVFQPYLQDLLGDRPTDHVTCSVTIGGAHSGEAKFCYCLRLQQIFIGAVDSTDRINVSNQ